MGCSWGKPEPPPSNECIEAAGAGSTSPARPQPKVSGDAGAGCSNSPARPQPKAAGGGRLLTGSPLSTPRPVASPGQEEQPLKEYFQSRYLEGALYEGHAYEYRIDPDLDGVRLLLHPRTGIKVWGEALDLTAAAPECPTATLFYYTGFAGLQDLACGRRSQAEIYSSLEERPGDFGVGAHLFSKEPEAFGTREAVVLNKFWDGGLEPHGASPEEGARESSTTTMFNIFVRKEATGDNSRMGLDITKWPDPAVEGVALQINRIHPGLVDKWNRENPTQAVEPGDLIVDANGSTGATMRILEAIAGAEALSLTIERTRQPPRVQSASNPGHVGSNDVLTNSKYKAAVCFCIVVIVPSRFAFDIWKQHAPKQPKLEDGSGPQAERQLGTDRTGKRQREGRDVVVVQLDSEALARLEQDGLSRSIQVLEKRLARVERSAGVSHENTIATLSSLARMLSWSQRISEAERLHMQALARSEQTLGASHPVTVTCVNNLAVFLQSLSRGSAARPLLERAVEGREKVLGFGHPHTLQSLHNLGSLLQEMGHSGEAEPHLRKALQGREDYLGMSHVDTLQSLDVLSSLLQKQGQLSEATSLCRRALRVKEATLGQMHPNTMISLNNLAVLLKSSNQHEEAEELYQRALEGCKASVGVHHPNTLTVINNLAVLKKAKGDLREAELLARQALQVAEEVMGPVHKDTLTHLNNLAVLLHALGRLGEAEPLLRRALDGRTETLGALHPDTTATLNNLAVLMQVMENFDEADMLFKRAIARRETALGPAHLDTLASLSDHGMLLLKQGRHAEAEPLLRRAAEGREAALGSDHPDTEQCRRGLAMVQVMKSEEKGVIRLNALIGQQGHRPGGIDGVDGDGVELGAAVRGDSATGLQDCRMEGMEASMRPPNQMYAACCSVRLPELHYRDAAQG